LHPLTLVLPMNYLLSSPPLPPVLDHSARRAVGGVLTLHSGSGVAPRSRARVAVGGAALRRAAVVANAGLRPAGADL